MKKPDIDIVDYRPEFQVFFENLYSNWFRNHFLSEPESIDWAVLKDPIHSIMSNGGSLLIGICNQEPAGSVALKKQDGDTFELTKMVIDEKFRGQGIGESLCREAIQRAKSMGARRLILYSHSSLRAALQLYRKTGFREIPLEKGLYSHFRCDTKMEFLFDPFAIIHAGKDLAWTLSQIGRKSFHDAFLPYFHDREELIQYLDYTYEAGKIERSLADPNHAYFVAFFNGEACGFAKIKKLSPNASISAEKQTELQKIYLLKEFQGQGIADKLLNQVLEFTQSLSADEIWLHVIVQNARAIRFYERNGFIKCGDYRYQIGSQVFDYHLLRRPTARQFSAQSRTKIFSYGDLE